MEAAGERRFQRGNAIGINALMAGGHLGEALEIGAVARMGDHQRAVEFRFGKFLAPHFQRAHADLADHRLGGLGLAERREHAAGPMAGGLRHRLVAALIERDFAAGARQQQRVPRTGNASADHRYRSVLAEIWKLAAFRGRRGKRHSGRLSAHKISLFIHPCPFAGMTRIRFKGSPRSRTGPAVLPPDPRGSGISAPHRSPPRNGLNVGRSARVSTSVCVVVQVPHRRWRAAFVLPRRGHCRCAARQGAMSRAWASLSAMRDARCRCWAAAG